MILYTMIKPWYLSTSWATNKTWSMLESDEDDANNSDRSTRIEQWSKGADDWRVGILICVSPIFIYVFVGFHDHPGQPFNND